MKLQFLLPGKADTIVPQHFHTLTIPVIII